MDEDYLLWAGGVAMQTQAYAISEMPGRRGLPEPRNTEVFTLGQVGSVSVWGGLEPTYFSLIGWVDCIAPDGSEPADHRAQFEQNISTVLGLVAHRRFQLSQKMPDGTMRYAEVERTGRTEVTERYPGGDRPIADFEILLKNPRGFWTDRTTPAVFDSYTFGTAVHVTTLQRDAFVGPVVDAEIRIHGPIDTPRIECGSAYFQYNGTIPAGQVLTIQAGRQRAYIGAANVVISAIYGGSQHGLFDLWRPHMVKVSGGATSGSSHWEVEAFPRFA